MRLKESRWSTRIGALTFPWVVCGYGPFEPDAIESFFHAGEPRYPPEIDDALQTLEMHAAERAAQGEWFLRDFEGYKLVRFQVPPRMNQYADPRLILHFAPTSFHHALITDQLLDEPMALDGVTTTLRQRYVADADLRERPVPELATLWGVACSVITADGLLLISERRSSAGEAHVLVPAVTNFAVRTLDADGEGAPDHTRIARRSTDEHLGIELAVEELRWLSFGASAKLCSYALIGRIDTKHSLEDIERRRSLGVAAESARTRQLHAVEFTPRAVAEFCAASERRFSALALVAIVHALMSEFGVARVEEAFGRTSVTLAHNLPTLLDSMSGGA